MPTLPAHHLSRTRALDLRGRGSIVRASRACGRRLSPSGLVLASVVLSASLITTTSTVCTGCSSDPEAAVEGAVVSLPDPCGDRSGLQPGAPWPMFGGCPTHVARSPYLGPQNPKVRWKFQTGGDTATSPVVAADGTVYVNTSTGYLLALTRDGSEEWKSRIADPTPPHSGQWTHSTPAIGMDGTVYVGSRDSHLYAIAPDGRQRWAFDTAGAVFSSPVIAADGTVYVGSTDEHLYAVTPDGQQRWAFGTDSGIVSSPAIGAGGIVYVASSHGYLYAITAGGKQQWRFPLGDVGWVFASPSVGMDGTVYVGSGEGCVYAIWPTGKLKWAFEVDDAHLAFVAIATDSTAYAAAGRLYAISSGGQQKWKQDFSVVRPFALDADDTLYVVGEESGLLRAIAADGQQKWELPISNSTQISPAIGADGTLYIGPGYDDGSVYAIDP